MIEQNIKNIENFIKNVIKPITLRIIKDDNNNVTNIGPIYREHIEKQYRNLIIYSKNKIDDYYILIFIHSIVSVLNRNTQIRLMIKDEADKIYKDILAIINHVIETKKPNQFEQDKQVYQYIQKINRNKTYGHIIKKLKDVILYNTTNMFNYDLSQLIYWSNRTQETFDIQCDIDLMFINIIKKAIVS